MASDAGLGHACSMRVFKAFFQEDRDIGDIEVLVDIAAEVGLNPVEARSALINGTYVEQHKDARRHAEEEMKITVVPTIVVGNKVFRGSPSVEELINALADLERHKV